MTTTRRWNWEAALVPGWGWLRRVPMARALSLAFPLLVVAAFGKNGTLIWSDVIPAVGFVSVAYGVLYGLAGDWMLKQARAKQTPDEPTLTRAAIMKHLLFTALALLVNVLILFAASSSQHDHRTPVRAAMKADLRNLVTAQEAHFYDHNRYAGSLDSLEYAPSSMVTVRFLHADSLSWAAEASYRDVRGRCRISIGRWSGAPVDTLEGVPLCDPELEAP